MNVVSREVDLLARDLVRLLGDLAGLHAELAMHMRGKLEAIKQADAGRIQSITARETLLADKAAEREGLRRQITARIIKGLGVEDKNPTGGPITLTQLAEFFPEPRRSQLLVAAAGLREKVREIDALRQTLSLITREMLEHLTEVLKVMCAGVGTDVYSRTGQRQNTGVAAVFEAVG
ncbi:MAG TPA: flagellar export chaperone FlgN [Phycisphaerae bacterium]|nr:flagellar export chaperone FlgN [Phycisphaerae bacterium]